MWPFRSKPAPPEIDLGQEGLRRSQLEITRGYGWQESLSADDQKVFRDSLERHEDALLPGSENTGRLTQSATATARRPREATRHPSPEG
jgi:hypothetical protein